MLRIYFNALPPPEALKLLSKYGYSVEYQEGQHVVSVYFPDVDEIVEGFNKLNLGVKLEMKEDLPFLIGERYEAGYDDMEFEMSSTSVRYFAPSLEIIEPKPVIPSTSSTEELEEKLSIKIQTAVIDAFSHFNDTFQSDMAKQMKQIQSLSANSTPIRPSVQAKPSAIHSSTVNPSTARQPQPSTSQGFVPKNELVANGIKCERCLRTLKENDVSKLVDTLRTHVLEHFEQKCTSFKRFRCKEHPDFVTNFVKEIEQHLGRHGSLERLPDKRARLVEQLMSQEYLNYLADMAHECFPEVFEVDPQPLASIEFHTAPLRSFRNVFPHLYRDFCSRYALRDTRMDMRRSSVPTAVINLD